MLYPRWFETARRHASETAVFDDAGGLTFAALAAAAEAAPRAGGPVIARSGDPGFFVEILRAWRDGQPVIPVERDAPVPVLHCTPPSGTALVKHTPGASGIPRGIFLSDAQVAADGDRLTAAMRLTPETPNLAAVSLAHSYGFSNIVLPMLLHGVPLHLAPVPFPRVIEEVFRRHGRMVVPAVPPMWRAWHRAGILKDAPIALALSAGAPLPLALEQEVHAAHGLKIRNFYGASECGGISMDFSDTPRETADDVGTPLPGVEVTVARDGRMLVTSDAVASGYDEEREDDLLENGRYLTRDTGFLDAAGRLHLTGTLGGAINVAGRKISPAKVEAALMATGLVRRACVTGIPSADPERNAEIQARCELLPGVAIDELKKALTSRLETWELPRHWREW